MIKIILILAALLALAVVAIVLLLRHTGVQAKEAQRLKAGYNALATTVKGWNDKASKTADAIGTVRKEHENAKTDLKETADPDLALRANSLFPPRS